MKSTMLTIFVWAILCIATATAGQILFWAYWPEVPMTLTAPIRVLDVQPGNSGARSIVTYSMSYCKEERYSELEAEVHYVVRSIDKLSVMELTGTSVGGLATGCNTLLVRISIPGLFNGKHVLEMTRVYTVNPIGRKVIIRSSSPIFEVKPEPPGTVHDPSLMKLSVLG